LKIVIAGGTGQVGSVLSRAFHGDGHEVVLLSRNLLRDSSVRIVPWDAQTHGDWRSEIDGADVVINLAGRTVNCRYNPENRRTIKDSRVKSTRIIGEAIAGAARPPRVWLQMSTATIYAHRYDAANDEAEGIIGGAEKNAPDTWRFSIDVALGWELALDEALVPQTRKVKMRAAMVMSPDAGGVFDTLLGLVRCGLGGKSGDGRQYVSWIHHEDFVRAVYWLIDHDELEGPVNLASPNPLPNVEFMRELRSAWGIRIGMPATKLMLEIGARFLKTETELILKSRRVVPGRLLEGGFRFLFPTWKEAAGDLVNEWYEIRKRPLDRYKSPDSVEHRAGET
jgi:uncharacterized protein (TIGR01777 family)